MSQALEEMQAFFATAIRQSVEVAQQRGGQAQASRFIGKNSRLSAAAQLEIYREQFWLRHIGALEEDFVTIHHLLGHAGFTTLVERYLEAHPPVDFSLRDLGAKLPRFVESHPEYGTDPLLVDCARLEWAFVDAFDAPDAAPLDPASIAAIPEDAWAAARLSLHPSVQRVALFHPTHDFRAAIRAGEDPPRPPPASTHVVVYRGPESLHYVEIEPLAFDLLARLASGETLGEAGEGVAGGAAGEDAAAELEAKIAGWFQFWTASGWVSTVTV